MIIELNPDAKDAEKGVKDWVAMYNHESGKSIRVAPAGDIVHLLLLLGDTSGLNESQLAGLDGVERITRVLHPYKAIARNWLNGNKKTIIAREDSKININGESTTPVVIGNRERPVYIVGVCTVESEEQTLRTAEEIAGEAQKLGIGDRILFRGGAWKPRTEYSPASFRGLEWKAIDILEKVRKRTKLLIGTEVMDTKDVDELAWKMNWLWVGADNWCNQALLLKLAETDIPVGYKSPKFNVPFETWLKKSYFLAGARAEARHVEPNMFYIHRGTVTEATDRALLNLGFMRELSRLVTLPGVIDISHAAGNHEIVPEYLDSVIATRPHAVMVELVYSGADRSRLKCDGKQALYVRDFFNLIKPIEERMPRQTPAPKEEGGGGMY